MQFTRNEREWQLTKQGYDIQYSLSWDGDCWLSAISYLLGRIEISKWADLLQQEVVKYLQSKSVATWIGYWTCMASFSLLNNKGESEETSRIFCGNVNFPEIDRGISLFGGIKLNNHKD